MTVMLIAVSLEKWIRLYFFIPECLANLRDITVIQLKLLDSFSNLHHICAFKLQNSPCCLPSEYISVVPVPVRSCKLENIFQSTSHLLSCIFHVSLFSVVRSSNAGLTHFQTCSITHLCLQISLTLRIWFPLPRMYLHSPCTFGKLLFILQNLS